MSFATLAGTASLGVLGGFLAVVLLAHYGFAETGHALAIAGWSGLGAMTLYHLIPLSLCAWAWRTQSRSPPAGPLRYVWFRWVRDSAADVLAFVPAAGELLGIRAMVLAGVTADFAVASTMVDLTMEISAQVLFTLLGLTVLILGFPDARLVHWTLMGLAVTVPLLCVFVLAQRCGGLRLLQRLARRFAGAPGWRGIERAAAIDAAIAALYRGRTRILLACAIHFTAWVVGIGEAGIGLYLMGVPQGLASLIVLESLSYALRSAAFFVPAAAGVQEGGYVMLGGALGLGPDFALALSLLKRGRGIILGSLALLLWQALEGGRWWQRLRLSTPND